MQGWFDGLMRRLRGGRKGESERGKEERERERKVDKAAQRDQNSVSWKMFVGGWGWGLGGQISRSYKTVLLP